MIKKAFILAAGLGTRLGKLTDNKPKALLEINGIPMLQLVIERLLNEGIDEFIINIHHHGQQVIDFLNKNENFGATIHISDEQDLLLDTGGAIAKAKAYFTGNDQVLIHNVDVISNLDIKELEIRHNINNAIATLCVRQRQSNRYLLFDDEMKLVGWRNTLTGEFKWIEKPKTVFQAFAYSGIYLVNSNFAGKISFKGNFSIIDAWLKMAANETIIGYPDNSPVWFDLGTKQKLKEAENYLKGGNVD